MRLLSACLGAALVLTACGDLNTGSNGYVVNGRVTSVLETGTLTSPRAPDQPFQKLAVQLDEGLYRGEVVTVEWRGRGVLDENGLLSVGDRVLLTETREDTRRTYAIQEIVRLPALVPFAVLLVVALLIVGRFQGLASIAGLAASAAVLLQIVVPALRRGADPLVAALAGSAVVLALSVFVVHGVNRKSVAALLGTLTGLVVVSVLATLAVAMTHITGLASEEAVFVLIGAPIRIDPARLVLAGLIVGSLGALVDMSVGQASTVFELARVDPGLGGRRLYASALNVGRDHIGSLVNTLAFAYIGGAFPLIMFLSLGFAPLSTALNSEEITGSILQTLVASCGLVLCVPATTAFAVLLAGRSRRE